MTVNKTVDSASHVEPWRPPNPHLTPVFEIAMRKVRDYAGPTMNCPDYLGRLFADYLRDKDREHFAVALLATNLRVIGLHTVSVGTISAALVSARDVFKPALLANAARIAVSHNHPSNNPEPSREDVQVTKRLVEAGKLLDVPVLDHLIVTPDGAWTSLSERGLM